MQQQTSKTRRATILIADDCEYSFVPLEIALECLEGFRVLRALDMEDACDILFRGSTPIDVLIADTDVLQQDGYALMGMLRGDQRYCKLPIVAISAEDDGSLARRMRLLGADAFFLKPFSQRVFREKVRKLIGKSNRIEAGGGVRQ